MTPIKRHCQFLVDKEKGKEDGRLRYRIKWNGEIIAFNVGYRAYLSKWSKETQRCKANTTHGRDKVSAYEINRVIQTMEDDIASIFYKYEREDIIPTKDNIRSDYNTLSGRASIEESNNFTEVFNLYIKTVSKISGWSNNMCIKMKTTLNHILSFNKDIKLTDINTMTLCDFAQYLLSKNLRNITVDKYVDFYSWFIKWAKKNNYIEIELEQIEKPHLKMVDKEVVYLEWTELMKLFRADFSYYPPYDKTRDIFCFCCFTGLRYSDINKLKRADVYDGYIEIVTQKTYESLRIELNKYSKKILEKHKSINYPLGKALPSLSNQKMNNYLKDIARLLKFNSPIKSTYFKGNNRYEEVRPKHELLTTHCGRKTFVVNALSLGIPPHVIMKWTGHKSMEAMKPYTKIIDQLKKDEMDKFNY